jgi:hypothetical protein
VDKKKRCFVEDDDGDIESNFMKIGSRILQPFAFRQTDRHGGANRLILLLFIANALRNGHKGNRKNSRLK